MGKHIVLTNQNEKEIVKETIQCLRDGGLVVFPTDTVYGFLVDATNEQAVKKLIAFKNRPYGKPISVFAADFTMLESLVTVHANQKRLLKNLLPGPFTVVLDSQHTVNSLLESEKGTLGVRLPDYPLIQRIVKHYGKAVTATSANISGRKPHYQIPVFLKELPKKKKDLIDLIVDGGVLPRNKPSTILDLTRPTIRMLRKGDIVCKTSERFFSDSPSQTEKIAHYVLQKNKTTVQKNPLVFILLGDVGAGKTVFAKGIGKSLGIKNIISPTYVIYYEYEIQTSEIQKLYHFDLYNIQEDEELKHLGIGDGLQKGNLFVFEWGEKTGSLLPVLKERATIYFVTISYVNEKEREIEIKQYV